MIPPQYGQDMVPLLIQTLKKPLRNKSGGDFHSDYKQPSQGGHSKAQEMQSVVAMDTSSLQGQPGTKNMKQHEQRDALDPEHLLATGW